MHWSYIKVNYDRAVTQFRVWRNNSVNVMSKTSVLSSRPLIWSCCKSLPTDKDDSRCSTCQSWWCRAVSYFWSYRQIRQINHDITVPLPAHRAILRRARQEELQQLQNVPVVPTRLRRGELRGRAGPPHPVLPRRLRQPSAPIQSQHQLRGLLLHHAEAFKQGEQVHRLPRLLGVKKKTTKKHHVRWVCFRGCVRCVVVWKREDACGCVCICVETVLNDRARFDTCSFWLS